MRRWILQRDVDVTGVSGKGVVVWGIEWPDGTVSYRWNTVHATTVSAAGIGVVKAVHLHDGASRIVWVDGADASTGWKEYEERPEGPDGGVAGEPAAGGPETVGSRPRRARGGLWRRLVAGWAGPARQGGGIGGCAVR